MNEREYEILQLIRNYDSDYARKLYMSFAWLQENGMEPVKEEYESVYKSGIPTSVTNLPEFLEEIYATLNVMKPACFHGHALSVSDVVLIRIGSREVYYYCDSVGFVELTEWEQ